MPYDSIVAPESANSNPTDPDLRPNVRVTGDLHKMVEESLAAIEISNFPPHLYIRGDAMVYLWLKDNQPSITSVCAQYLRGYLAKHCYFYQVTYDSKGNEKCTDVHPPSAVVSIILATPEGWVLPRLDGITQVPVVRRDGSVLNTPGYDEQLRYYYCPVSGLAMPNIPDHLRQQDAKAAAGLIREVVCDFPFVEHSEANYFAALLTPILRPLLDSDCVPAFLLDAPTPGTGKGLLTDLIAIIHTGSPAANEPPPGLDETETEKRLLSILLAGKPLTFFDNQSSDRSLESAALDCFLTSSMYSGRFLGQSKMVTVPNRTTVFITGNNVKTGGDLLRRCVQIRLDAQVVRPWERSGPREGTGWKHPELKEWATLNRGRLIGALIIMISAWYQAGCPRDRNIRNLGGFEGWTRTVAGILKFAGVEGFLSNLHTMYETADPDSGQWEAFVTGLRKVFGDQKFKVAEITERLDDSLVPDSVLEGVSPEKLASKEKRLGKAIRAKAGRYYGDAGLHLVAADKDNSNRRCWKVEVANIECWNAQQEKAKAKQEKTGKDRAA